MNQEEILFKLWLCSMLVYLPFKQEGEQVEVEGELVTVPERVLQSSAKAPFGHKHW